MRVEEDPRERLNEADREKFEALRALLRSVMPDFEKMALSLRKDIGNRYYDTILADDISGRLVGHFVRRLMSRDGESEGYDPKLLFYAGGQDGDAGERVRSDIEKLKPLLGERVLLVTELINTGGSIRFAREALEERGRRIGVASLAIMDQESIRTARGSGFKKPKFYQGGFDGAAMHMSGGAGVKKDYKQGGIITRDPDESGMFVAAARREMQEMADEVYEKYYDSAGPNYINPRDRFSK